MNVEVMDVSYVFKNKLVRCKAMYFGIANNILVLSKNHNIPERIQLQVNVDGLPLWKSSSKTFWTILGRIPKVCSCPFIIGLSFGNNKPDLLKFFQPFTEEINELADSGIYINENLTVILEPQDIVAICDVPAKCFCKNVKGHTGYSSCHYCKIEGTNVPSNDGRSHQRIFLETNCQKRSMECFRDSDNNDHCQGPTPFMDIEGFNIVEQFPPDAMHLCFLGVTKRLLNYYVKGVRSTKLAKLNAAKIDQLSESIESYSTNFPNEMPRKPRGLHELDRWKAVEYKNFLLYIGIIVLRDIIDVDAYEHFLMLSIGIRILNSSFINKESYLDCAQDLLKTFVEFAHIYFGNEFLSLNVHTLIHLVDYCKKYGRILDFSAFPFENFLYSVKKNMKSAKNPLESVRRQMETSGYSCYDDHVSHQKIIVGQCTLISENKYEIKLLTLKNEIMSKQKNNCYWIMKGNNMIIKVVRIVKNIMGTTSQIVIEAQKANKIENYFTKPIPSKDVGIYKVIFQNEIINIVVEEITNKVLGLPINDRETIVFKFCHHVEYGHIY